MPVPSTQPNLQSLNNPIVKLTIVAATKILRVSSSNYSVIKTLKVFGGITIALFNPKYYSLNAIESASFVLIP